MQRRFRRLGDAFEAIGRANERISLFSRDDPVTRLSRRACVGIIIVAALIGVILPIANFEVRSIPVIALGLGTIGAAVHAMGRESAISTYLRTLLALLLLAVTFGLHVLLSELSQ
ncbi:MAG TPA: hypothetical protein DGT23_35200 [Micromonosporaceae bacterium]|nr:hypothetical protein [Micromonosporaceae bacterium]